MHVQSAAGAHLLLGALGVHLVVVPPRGCRAGQDRTGTHSEGMLLRVTEKSGGTYECCYMAPPPTSSHSNMHTQSVGSWDTNSILSLPAK